MDFYKIHIRLFLLIAISFSFGCKEFGVQGGKVDIAFVGLDNIKVISPSSVKLSWTKDSKYLNYRIYMKGNSLPIGSSSFSEYVVTGLNPDTSYEFSVSGYSEGDLSEDFQQNFKPTKTYKRFLGLAADGITVTSATRVDLTWVNAGSNVTYEVTYKKNADSEWTEDATVAATNNVNVVKPVTGLLGGTEYCIRVTAKYLDGTFLPAENDHVDNCVTTFTDLLSLPTIYSGSNSPGNYPWFNAVGGNPAYRIEIYNEADSDSPIASTNNGAGAFRASTFLPPSKNDVYAIVKDVSSGVQARVEVTYSDSTKPDLSTRNFFDDPVVGAVHPPLINNGKGVQRLGSQIKTGDFNCDGLPDIAVAAPKASPVENEDLIYETGAVIIYYSYDPPFDNATATDPPPFLKTDGVPAVDSVFPEPHLIHYPLNTGSNLGTKLEVANFNGDCFYRDVASPASGSCSSLYETHKSSSTNIEKIKSCDDLVITGATSARVTFAVYGDPLSGLVSGAGGANFGIDEYTCDASSSSCRSVRLNDSSTAQRTGLDLGSGDFNNDGFDDLLISSSHLVSGVSKRVVHVLRGTNQGLTPIGHPNSFKSIETDDTGIFASTPPTEADGFGFSLTGFYNSRECMAGSSFEYRKNGPSQGYGYDFTKCDDVVIGAPQKSSNRGSIYTCKGVLPAKNSVTDDEKITNWVCSEHYPNEIENDSDGAYYGYSLLSVENQNGYPLSDNKIKDVGFPDVTGALFVGAPYRTVGGVVNAGAVYSYYVTPTNDDHGVGGIQGVLTGVPGHDVNSVNSVACDVKNVNCNHQKITNSPPQAGSRFGNNISHVESIVGDNLPYVAISAPFRDVASSDGNSNITDSGLLYLYGPDISTFGVDSGAQVTETQRNTSASANCSIDCTWYSGGLSPFGPVVIYPTDLNNSAYFGLGGVVGGDYNADGFGDLYAGAERYSDPIESNGAIFGFHSNDGSFSAVENGVDKLVNTNISKELNYRFENAKIIGDVNGDGYDDVVSKIEVGEKIQLVLYYGSSTGLIKTADPAVNSVGFNPKILFNNTDTYMGDKFYRIGSVNCDSFDDFLLIGGHGAYIYHGSSTGVIAAAQPSPTPVGKNPLSFGRGFGANHLVSLQSGNIQNGSEEGSYDSSNQSVGYGDFNNDNCADIAIGVRGTYNFNSVTNSSDLLELNIGTNNYSSANEGRTIVIYGSINGLQINDPNGYLRLSSAGGAKGNLVADSPCVGGVCSVQMLSSPGPTLTPSVNGQGFGYDVIGIPSLGGKDGELTSELLVSDPYEDGNNGAVYVFQGSTTGIINNYYQSLVPNLSSFGGDTTDFSGELFGLHMASVGDLNQDDYPDVVISAPNSHLARGHVYIFYGGKIGSDAAFVGEDTLGDRDFWGASSSHLSVNQKFSSSTIVKPQILDPVNLENNDMIGSGISGIGDFNSDGFNDVMVNIALGDYLQEVSLENAGMTIIYFGSDMGLQIDKEESTAPKCIYSNVPEECAPFQLHLPSRQVKERSYISNSCSGDVNGDGVSDILVGARGRHHPSGQATATGVFYIMY